MKRRSKPHSTEHKKKQAEIHGRGSGSPARICVLDSDPDSLNDVTGLLVSMGCEVLGLSSVIGASNRIRRFDPDLIVVDITVPSLSGIQLIEVLRKNLGDLPRLILFSALSEEILADVARKVKAADYLVKNGNYLELVNRVRLHSARL